MDETQSFGHWLKQRRRALDVTRAQLGAQVGCSTAALTKIEAGLRYPSQQLARRILEAVQLPDAEIETMIQWARGRATDTMLSLTATTGQLPIPPTPLFGREHDLDLLMGRLLRKDSHLLTLHGPPGVGKTRLALELGLRLQHVFPDGVDFIQLASLRDPALILEYIAHSLHVQAGVTQEAIVESLYIRHSLLILDNMEHVLGAAPQIAKLLSYCPMLKILVTSRERLHIRGERLFQVQPLSLPEAHTTDLQLLSEVPAIALFVEAAQAVHGSFRLDLQNSELLIRLCQRLDGLPLALEIVAARSVQRSLHSLLEELDQHLLLDRQGPGDLPERQRTLRAALHWSYSLLTAAEQDLLGRLSVPLGSWPEELAIALSDGTPSLDTLLSLVNKNLVQQQLDSAQAQRFSMLETIREYAYEQLRLSGQAEHIHQLHAHHYYDLVQQAAPQLTGTQQTEWLTRLDAAHSNIQAALEWFLKTDHLEDAAAMALALRRFWWMRGYASLGRRWLSRIIAYEGQLMPKSLAWLCVTEGNLALSQGDVLQGNQSIERGLLLARDVEDIQLLSFATHSLGTNLLGQGDYQRAQALIEESLAYDRELGDLWGVAVSSGTLADVYYALGHFDKAHALYTECLTLYRRLDDQHSCMIILNNLGEFERDRGQSVTAQALLEEAAQLAHSYGFVGLLPQILVNLATTILPTGEHMHLCQIIAEVIELEHSQSDLRSFATISVVCAALALQQGATELATMLLAYAETVRQKHQIAPSSHEHLHYAELLQQLQGLQGEASFTSAWGRGQQLSTEVVLQHIQGLIRV